MKDKLPGGKGDSRPDSDFDAKWLAAGIKVEREHTEDPAVAKEIAKDHLTEDPLYYKKLRKIEKSMDAEIAMLKAAELTGPQGGHYHLTNQGGKVYTGKAAPRAHAQVVQNIKTATKAAMHSMRTGKIGHYEKARQFLSQYDNHSDPQVRRVLSAAHGFLHQSAQAMIGKSKTVKAAHIYALIRDHHKQKSAQHAAQPSSPPAQKRLRGSQDYRKLAMRMGGHVAKFADKILSDIDNGYDMNHAKNIATMNRLANHTSKKIGDSSDPAVRLSLAKMHSAARDAMWRLYKKWGEESDLKDYSKHSEHVHRYTSPATMQKSNIFSGVSVKNKKNPMGISAYHMSFIDKRMADIKSDMETMHRKGNKNKKQQLHLEKRRNKKGAVVGKWIGDKKAAKKSVKKPKTATPKKSKKPRKSAMPKSAAKKASKKKSDYKKSDMYKLQIALDSVMKNPAKHSEKSDKLNWKLIEHALKEGDDKDVTRALKHVQEALK